MLEKSIFIDTQKKLLFYSILYSTTRKPILHTLAEIKYKMLAWSFIVLGTHWLHRK